MMCQPSLWWLTLFTWELKGVLCMGKFDTKETVYKYVIQKKANRRKGIPQWLQKEIVSETLGDEEFPCYHIMLSGKTSDRKVFYLYDSEHCYSMAEGEWRFVYDLMKLIDAEFYIPMYPLAPEKSCKDHFDVLIKTFSELISGFDMEKVILMGAGTGAGSALSLNMIAWQEGLAMPYKTVLLAPVLDAEYKDHALRLKMQQAKDSYSRAATSQAAIDFVREYWVKDYEGNMEYTSPIHEGTNYVTGKVLVASGARDCYNVHSRQFCRNMYDSGKKPYYFEYRNAGHAFYLDRKNSESRHLRKILQDFMTDSRSAIIDKYLYEVRHRGIISKRFPTIFKDEIATKYLANHKINSEDYKRRSEYRNLVSAATSRDYDEAVKLFLMEYPESTVVYVGCSLDTMFERVDNGRVMWYNLDSPGRIAVRNMYTTDSCEREKIIDRSVNDLTWLDEIDCEIDKGLLFIFRDILSYYKEDEVRDLMKMLYERYQGCNVLFEAHSQMELIRSNRYAERMGAEYRRRKFYMNYPASTIESWDPRYSVISSKPILDGIKMSSDWSPKLKIMFQVRRLFQGTRIMRIRLGYEKFAALFEK